MITPFIDPDKQAARDEADADRLGILLNDLAAARLLAYEDANEFDTDLCVLWGGVPPAYDTVDHDGAAAWEAMLRAMRMTCDAVNMTSPDDVQAATDAAGKSLAECAKRLARWIVREDAQKALEAENADLAEVF